MELIRPGFYLVSDITQPIDTKKARFVHMQEATDLLYDQAHKYLTEYTGEMLVSEQVFRLGMLHSFTLHLLGGGVVEVAGGYLIVLSAVDAPHPTEPALLERDAAYLKLKFV